MKRWLLAALVGVSPAAQAELTRAGPGGFTSSHALETPAEPAAVWAQMQRIGEWWNPDHSWSGKAESLYFDTGEGCFCEKLPGGGRVEHLRILYLAPAAEIRLDGALGPLQSMGVNGRMIWAIEPTDGASRIRFTYHVFGDPAAGLENIAPAVDGVIGEQLARLGASLAR